MYISGTKEVEFAAIPRGVSAGRDIQTTRRPAPIACRIFDIIFAMSGLIFVAPLMIVVAIAIKIQDGGPIFFGHSRIGYEGRSFRCWKFRSMVVDAEARLSALLARDPEARREWEADQKLRRDPRVTLLGRFLRVSSVDEIPQLFNVLRGEMSLVGPRPIVTGEVARYGRRFAQYCSVRPGITGLWQISGRNDVSYRRRVAIDTVFANTLCLSLYLKILFATVPAVMKRDGSY
ncbi:sugar transferase [Phenylobacterium sp. LjRoot219]|uniref:sugar transferase n=1 Tax=Phenylobacterium sp. LjRoot219 TaxID=3342283 RepID=UPI003ED157D1